MSRLDRVLDSAIVRPSSIVNVVWEPGRFNQRLRVHHVRNGGVRVQYTLTDCLSLYPYFELDGIAVSYENQLTESGASVC